MRPARVLRAAVLGAALVTGGAACGGDGPQPAAGSETSSPAPGEEGTSPAEVASALREVADLASDVAAATGSDAGAAEAADGRIDEAWAGIEGRIRDNDAAAYVDLQDALAALGSARDEADRERATAAAERLASLVAAYLARFPADGSTAAPTASPAPSDF